MLKVIKFRLTISFVSCLFLFSCVDRNHNIIYYQYKKVVVTRVDIDGASRFYLGKIDKFNIRQDTKFIEAKYSGFDAIMGAYIDLSNSDTIKVILQEGLFKKKNNCNDFIVEDYENIHFINWRKKIWGDFKGVVFVSNSLKYEKKINKECKSKVKVRYPSELDL